MATKDHSPARWKVGNGVMTVEKAFGNIETKQQFKNYQLHLEWRIPKDIAGEGQLRGNSGVFLASTGAGDGGYEVQILDSWKNKTYVNGQAASIYKQAPPLVNAMRPPGEWQTYDVVWTAPIFQPTEHSRVRHMSRSFTTAFWCKTTCPFQAKPYTSESPPIGPIIARQSSCRRMAIRRFRSAFAIFGSENSHE